MEKLWLGKTYYMVEAQKCKSPTVTGRVFIHTEIAVGGLKGFVPGDHPCLQS